VGVGGAWVGVGGWLAGGVLESRVGVAWNVEAGRPGQARPG